MPRSHVEITVHAGSAAFDTIAGTLSAEGFEGFWEDGDVLRAYITPDRWRPEDLELLRGRLSRVTDHLALPPPSLTVRTIQEENWNRRWEETIRPIRVTPTMVIAPTWHPHASTPGEIVLTIDPKMSFGTGYHETTRLMLALLERYISPGARVLDAGTGTGVFAIAALKLGASFALGFDIDEWSFANAAENARLNGVSPAFIIRHGDLSVVHESGFDLIGANIQKNVIDEMLPGLTSRLAPGGTLLVSGILDANHTEMSGSFAAAGLAIAEERRAGEWVAYAVQHA